MTRLSLQQVVENLERNGYKESTNREFEDDKYFLTSDKTVINAVINKRKVQVGLIGKQDTTTLIALGDITMNCCAFDIRQGKILNTEMMDDAINKELKFCLPEEAKKDPWKIISALKQISRIPDLVIPKDTLEIIKSCIPQVIDYFSDNPSEKPDLEKICGNINSQEALDLFKGHDTKGIFDGVSLKKQKLEASEKYKSVTIQQLDPGIKNEVIELAKKSYGRRLQLDKLFNDKIESVVYEVDKNNRVLSCCLISGERIYAIASVGADSIVSLVSDLCRYNYTVWTTISLSSRHIIDLARKAGLKLISDSNLIKKILINNYPEYKDRIIVRQKRGLLTFVKEGSDDTEQVLLVS